MYGSFIVVSNEYNEEDYIKETNINSSLLHRSKLEDDSSMSSILNLVPGSSLESVATYYPDSKNSITSGHAHDYYIRAMVQIGTNSNAFSCLGSLCQNNEVAPSIFLVSFQH